MSFKHCILPLFTLLCIIALLFISPIPQDQRYHSFADQRMIFGVPNFFNVITNLPFLLIGIVGFTLAKKSKENRLKHIVFAIFFGFMLLAFGSSYYHLWPQNDTLVYDRIPIVIIMMSFFSFLIYDRIDVRKGYLAFVLFNIIGVLTVVYWILTEHAGNGDMRWYAMFQFYPIIAIPIILVLYKSTFNHHKEIIPMLVLFGIAKITETFDKEIYFYTGEIISGHSLKHLFMFAAGYFIVMLLRRRVRYQ